MGPSQHSDNVLPREQKFPKEGIMLCGHSEVSQAVARSCNSVRRLSHQENWLQCSNVYHQTAKII